MRKLMQVNHDTKGELVETAFFHSDLTMQTITKNNKNK